MVEHAFNLTGGNTLEGETDRKVRFPPYGSQDARLAWAIAAADHNESMERRYQRPAQERDQMTFRWPRWFYHNGIMTTNFYRQNCRPVSSASEARAAIAFASTLASARKCQ